MTIDWLVLIPLVVGHLALFVLTLNLLHSTALPERLLDTLNLALLFATLAALPPMLTQGPWTGWPAPARAYALSCLAVALVGLPAVTLLRATRRVPAGVATRAEGFGPDEPGKFVGEGRHNWLLRLPGNRSLQVQKVECDLAFPGLPAALDGLSIVQISDTHFARCYRREFFEAALDEAARWEPDLVAFTGDLLDDQETVGWVEPVMAQLRGRLGQFAILGNHDHRTRPGRARRALRRAGYRDLDGRWIRLEVDGATLALGGTSEPWGPALDHDAAPEADFRLVLSHSPDQFPRAASKGAHLVLAGHNHGGQVRLPVLGPILMPSRYSRHFDRGFFRSGEALLHVSQGLGGKHPIRYGCHPEITRLTLRSAPVANLPHRRGMIDTRLAREA